MNKSGLEGRLLACSETGAVLETAEELELFDNLGLDIGESLYAKVTEREGGRCRITFTAKPPCFSAWAETLMGKQG